MDIDDDESGDELAHTTFWPKLNKVCGAGFWARRLDVTNYHPLHILSWCISTFFQTPAKEAAQLAAASIGGLEALVRPHKVSYATRHAPYALV